MPDSTVKVSVTIPDRGLFEAVLKQAAAMGFAQDAAFPRLGVATGSVRADALERLRALEGVRSVELQRTYRAV